MNSYNVVDFIVERMRESLHGHWSKPESWKGLITREGCLLTSHKVPGCRSGAYVHVEDAPVIFYNANLSSVMLCRVLCHELAHYYQMSEPVSSLFDRGVYGYEGKDVYDTRHEIALHVEERFFGSR